MDARFGHSAFAGSGTTVMVISGFLANMKNEPSRHRPEQAGLSG
jgi:hypothetical protein